MDPIVAVASRAGVPIIEDAAQAIGARYTGRTLGGIGTLGCFSFYPSKNLSGFGDGGMVTTNDDTVAHRVRLLRTHGAEPKYYHKLIGGNFRLDALQAAVLRVKVPHLHDWTQSRRSNAARYDALLRSAGLAGAVADPEKTMTLPVEAPGCYHVYNQYAIRSNDRDALRAHLQAAGVGTEIYYPVPFHLQECFADLGYGAGAFPVAEAAARTTLALPIYPELTLAQQRYVVENIAAFYQNRKVGALVN
jgi:dTDP-4-amino-4,6-dideoxygalactose transaminase